jgi:hypothetical protein
MILKLKIEIKRERIIIAPRGERVRRRSKIEAQVSLLLFFFSKLGLQFQSLKMASQIQNEASGTSLSPFKAICTALTAVS